MWPEQRREEVPTGFELNLILGILQLQLSKAVERTKWNWTISLYSARNLSELVISPLLKLHLSPFFDWLVLKNWPIGIHILGIYSLIPIVEWPLELYLINELKIEWIAFVIHYLYTNLSLSVDVGTCHCMIDFYYLRPASLYHQVQYMACSSSYNPTYLLIQCTELQFTFM